MTENVVYCELAAAGLTRTVLSSRTPQAGSTWDSVFVLVLVLKK